MRRDKPLLLAFVMAGALGAATAHAGKKVENLNYWFMGAADKHTVFNFIDESTITYDGPTRSAWITKIAAGKAIAKYGMRTSLNLTIFNCKRNSLFESRIVTYDPRGATLLDHTNDNNDFRPVPPTGIEATELGFVCANPENRVSGKSWSKIDGAPESMADTDNKDFQAHQVP